ncbi:condensation domain-containing protein [Kitasatospora sp. NPDC048545]|uniref:condensation domain-containing protein n=1 Tax=Kitasatospora sp. NPDC048545 TaxID=3157208 RepID=UPI0033E76AC3
MTVHDINAQVRDIVVGIWLKALEYDDPEPEDRWFDFGGDSLGAVQLAGRLEREGISVDIAEFFKSPTLQWLVQAASDAMAAGQGPQAATAPSAPGLEQLPLTPTQLFTVIADGDTRNWHNDHLTVRLCEHATREGVKRAVQSLAIAHPALSARFTCDDGRWTQTLAPASLRSIPLVSLAVKGPEDVGPVDAAVRELGARFDIARGDLCVALVWEHEERPIALTLLFHHLCADGHSVDVLQHDLVAALHEPAGSVPREDNYLPWLNWLAGQTAGRRITGTDTTFDSELTIPMSELRHAELRLETGDLGSREIAPAILAAMSRAVRELSDVSARSIDITWHGREPIQGWPSLASTVGWFSQLRRLELPLGKAWAVPEAGRALKTLEQANESFVTGDSTAALLTAPAALYLNYRGSLRNTLCAPVSDCQPVDLDFGPQSSPDTATSYHLRVVADRVDGGVRLGLKYRADSPVAAGVIESLNEGLAP